VACCSNGERDRSVASNGTPVRPGCTWGGPLLLRVFYELVVNRTHFISMLTSVDLRRWSVPREGRALVARADHYQHTGVTGSLRSSQVGAIHTHYLHSAMSDMGLPTFHISRKLARLRWRLGVIAVQKGYSSVSVAFLPHCRLRRERFSLYGRGGRGRKWLLVRWDKPGRQ
jgi:hypothetical protein